MNIEPLAVTYTRALIELATKAGRLRQALEEMRLLARILKDVGEFRAFLESPVLDSKTKRESLDRIFRGKLDELVLNFLELLIDKKRQSLLPEIFAQCEELYDREVGRTHVEAITATPLAAPIEAELVEVLKGKLQMNVVLRKVVRPEILGGIILRWGDRVADGSVRTSLDSIGSLLKRTTFGSELVHENQSR